MIIRKHPPIRNDSSELYKELNKEDLPDCSIAWFASGSMEDDTKIAVRKLGRLFFNLYAITEVMRKIRDFYLCIRKVFTSEQYSDTYQPEYHR